MLKVRLKKNFPLHNAIHSPYSLERIATIIETGASDGYVPAEKSPHNVIKLGGIRFPDDWFNIKIDLLNDNEKNILSQVSDEYPYIKRVSGVNLVGRKDQMFYGLTGFNHLFDKLEPNKIYKIKELL